MQIERFFSFKQLSINIKKKRDSVGISHWWRLAENKTILFPSRHRNVFKSALKSGIWRHIQFHAGFKR